MTGIGGPDRERDFEDRWRTWAARPPRTSPAAAAAAVRERLRRPAPHRWWLPAAAAAALTVTALLSVRSLGPPRPASTPSSPAGAEATMPLGEGEVLLWLDEDTPLYMTYQQPSGGRQ